MYLKCLELVGFKSFAQKTRLEFAPGMMAIVGPNGCGKSNLSDAVRWVLGEQSPKAMRGAKMEDVIFSGTDAQKPLNVAEVSLMLTDCEGVLGTEYHEVTVTRRVHRSGEGEYLINRAPCRLKDIQRLFMDTGIGTNSYSLMEQGRIDRILSSRPEDRRSVFEEASGITKYKSDRREALRKLEQTEANLLRLDDVIREIKRQIISLQRQAGKARRYQSLQERLRELDLYHARVRLSELDDSLRELEQKRAALAAREETAQRDLREREERITGLRAEIEAIERDLEETREALSQARAERDRARETLRVNEERIRELRNISERDSHDAKQATEALTRQQTESEKLGAEKAAADTTLREAQSRLDTHTAARREIEERVTQSERELHRMRIEQLDLDRRLAALQAESSKLEARERETLLRRERLASEKTQLERVCEQYAARVRTVAERMDALREAVRARTEDMETLTRSRGERRAGAEKMRQTAADLKTRIAADNAEWATLQRSEASAEGYASGARKLLERAAKEPEAALLGPLAKHIAAEPGYETALQAVLRPWLDALLVADRASALRLLTELETRREGSATLFAADAAASESPTPEGPGESLAAHLRISEPAGRAVGAWLAAVRVVDSFDQIPSVGFEGTVVTRQGRLVQGGRFERWSAQSESVNPFARRERMDTIRRELDTRQTELDRCNEALRLAGLREEELENELVESRKTLDGARRELAEADGENRVVSRETEQARKRVETVTDELNALLKQTSSGDESRRKILEEMDAVRGRQAALREALATETEALRDRTTRRTEVDRLFTESRIETADRQRDVRELAHRLETAAARIRELNDAIRQRTEGAIRYRSRIEELEQENAVARDSLEPFAEQIRGREGRLAEIRSRREERQVAVNALEGEMHAARTALDGLREERGRADVLMAERRMRRQNLLERVGADYQVNDEQILNAPPPVAGEDLPDPSDANAIETQIADYRAKIQAIGPVNLVAIDEHRELEERHTFLTTQQNDLVQAKQQLTEMIRRINQTTTEMFSETFRKVNENFQEMFVKLFGGGSAKLVLVDEGDILESGIEIVARPPGKRLQSVSLLSGGERTMTAVGLLFALYLVKPSPFCVLDELDAALDEANINRFVKVVQEFVARSQFIVITHNRRTIAAADALFGVTMQQHGVSRIVSVRFQPDLPALARPDAAHAKGARPLVVVDDAVVVTPPAPPPEKTVEPPAETDAAGDEPAE